MDDFSTVRFERPELCCCVFSCTLGGLTVEARLSHSRRSSQGVSSDEKTVIGSVLYERKNICV